MKIILPREHGAWGMLFAPLLLGMAAGGLSGNHVLLFFGMLAAYLSSYPMILWIKNPKRNAGLKNWMFGYAAAAALFGIPLLLIDPHLLWLIVPALFLLSVNIWFAIKRRERHLLNDLSAICGLSLGAVAAYFVGQHTFDVRAWLLWIACLLVFFGSALHVKTLIREKGNLRLKVIANLYHIVLLVVPFAAHWLFPQAPINPWLFIAFLFAAGRTLFTPFNKNMRPLKIGILEIANTVWFVLAAGLVFHMTFFT